MNKKEKEVLVNDIKDNLSRVVMASGQPEELVRLTTSIVQGTKRLLEGVPESLTTSSTSALTAFVLCAKSVAKDPRSVDTTVIQQLSSTRSEVEKIVNELEKWHLRAHSPVLQDLTEVVESISKPQESRLSPEGHADSEREKQLTWELQRKRDTLLLKMDPQQSANVVNDPQEVMVTAVQGLMKGADELTKHSDGKIPSKDTLLEPMILVVDMVCKLLDLVDSLFVSKYPMRSQVYSFCTALIDNVLAYRCRTKSDDSLSLRNISTQTPALLNASKVMVEQCEVRLNSVQASMAMSMVRTKELKQMEDTQKDGISPIAKRRNKASVAPPPKPKTEPKPEFEVCCMVCTSVAVDQKTQQPISRGTELNLMIGESTTIKGMKQDLASRTGLLYDSIQLKQGQEELPDSLMVNPNSPLPYFLFNRDEPTEEELREKRKDERKKNKTTLENLDWSKITGPVAVAVFEYDTLGDERSLAFDEGDIIEIIERSADGWWEGRSADKVGTFPASFVKEISSKEEGIKLLELARRGNSASVVDEDVESGKSSPLERQVSDTSLSSSHSPRPYTKKKKNIISRGISNPEFSIPDLSRVKDVKEKALGSIFQKKKKPSGYSNLTVFDEESQEQQRQSPVEPQPKPVPPKPLYKPRKSFGSSNSSGISKPKVLGDDLNENPPVRSMSPKEPLQAPLEQNSPKPKPKQNTGGGSKKRAPPPRPQPYAKTHPVQAAKLNDLLQAQKTSEKTDDVSNEETMNFTVKSKNSNSMEDMLKDLQDFEDFEAVDRSGSVSSNRTPSVEYETCERPKTPPTIVETIKISEYKSDSENDDNEEELDGLEEDEDVVEEVGKSSLQKEWNPHEWTPSPEPIAKPTRKPPSWTFDVNLKQEKPLSKPNATTETSDCEKTKPMPPPKVMSRPRRSFSSSPKVTPSGSPKVTPSVSPKVTPSVSPKGGTPSSSPKPPPKAEHLAVEVQKPVAPPRNRKKGGNSLIDKKDSASRRGPSRAPPPPPTHKTSAIPTSQSETNIASSKVPPTSNPSPLQRR